MPIIQPPNWDILGFARIGPKDADDTDRAAFIKDRLQMLGRGEFQTGADNEIWYRDFARKKGNTFIPHLKEVARFDINNFDDQTAYDFIDTFRNTPYGSEHINAYSNEECKDLVGRLETSRKSCQACYQFSWGVSMCHPNLLDTFLRQEALPRFFSQFPKGFVKIYEYSYEYQKRYSLMRIGYAVDQYQIDEARNASLREGTAMLRKWQFDNICNHAELILELASFMFYPFVNFMVSGPVGLAMVFIMDEPRIHKLSYFPSTWHAYYQSKWDLADQHHIRDNSELRRKRLIHHRKFAVTDTAIFVDWLIENHNRFAFHQFDMAEFQKEGYVNAVLGLEHWLTVDRIVRKAISCISSEEVAVRKSAAFEIADLIEALKDSWRGRRGSEWFKKLFHPIEGQRIVETCLASLPEPYRSYLDEISSKVYLELQTVVKDSVWIASKVETDGVMVKDRTLQSENKESWPDFVSNVMRVFRNTHHGYLTTADEKSKRPSRYLAMVNGNTPDSLSYLGVLWALCLLANPKEMIGWEWIPTGFYD